MSGPEHEMASGDGRGRLRASHADRERVLGTLKAAYVYGLVTKDEFDERVSQTLAARTYADLAVMTADIPPGLAPLPSQRPASARSRAPAATSVAEDRAIIATAIVAGLAMVASVLVSPLARPGVSLAGVLAALLVTGGAGSGLVCVFLLGKQLRSQRARRPGSQQRRPGAGSGPSSAHRAISATPPEGFPPAAKPRRSEASAPRRHSPRPQLSS